MVDAMAKDKVTITADRGKIDEAKSLTGVSSTSELFASALERLIRAERLRADITAYSATPPTEDEIALAAITPKWDALSDDTDWEAAYRDRHGA